MVKCTSLLKIRKSYLDKHVMLSKGLESKDNLLKRQKEAGTGKWEVIGIVELQGKVKLLFLALFFSKSQGYEIL